MRISFLRGKYLQKAPVASLLALIGVSSVAVGQTWRQAKPGYRFSFPRDHFSHPDFRTEWWYFTGNLQAQNGHRFGYELTFFRQGNRVEPSAEGAPVWKPDQIFLAHLALSDIDGQRFFHTQRLNRAGPGLAGAAQHDSRYWNGNWQVRWDAPGNNNEMQLQAVAGDLRLSLRLAPQKLVAIQGQNGISRKGPAQGEASHYLSFTHIASNGTLQWQNQTYRVSGLSWMDHEFFSEPPDSGLLGWDWFSIQLENNTELMLYRLRRNDGSQDFSSGTFIDGKGQVRFLDASAFRLTPGETWRSKETNSSYPIAWHISVPLLLIELEATTRLPSQELVSKNAVSPTYWEGAVDYNGTSQGKPIKGRGYLEMTGYGSRMKLGTR